jgi:DNA-binding NarL/FixJ family response regulator
MDDGEKVASGILRVLIVDADARVRRGLRALLEGEPDIVVAGEAATVEQALRCGAVLRPSVILLDLMLPTVQDGLAALRLFTTHRRRCVAISWRDSLREAALEMGASGFVEKGAPPQIMLATLRTACRARKRLVARATEADGMTERPKKPMPRRGASTDCLG